jgi:hypothetical protein
LDALAQQSALRGDGDLINGLRNRTFARRHWVRNLDLD